MINHLIAWSLRNRFLVICGFLILTAWGVRSLYHTPVDAIPDLSENQVIVFADWAGRSPEEVEDQVTYPLSVNLQGLAGVKTVRAVSMFGFSLITVIFQDEVDNYFARARVLERLNYLTTLMPQGVTPQLGPDATGLGWVYQYYLEVDPSSATNSGYDLGQLRAIQDWFVRYQLNAVQGVAEVASIGGFVKQYQIEVSPVKMRAAGVMLADVMNAVRDSNLNVGGKVIEENGMEFVIRGVGLVKRLEDLENIVLKSVNDTPVYLRDIATVQLGGDFRRGTLDINGREVVGGIVVMRTGENAMEVIRRVKERIAQIQPGLARQGITIRPFYDRSELINRTIDTLKHALIEEIVLVTLAHIIFLFHFRSILIVTIPLPASILISFILMNQFGISSNIMSLAGIAIAIGVLVDAGIVMTENVIRHCERAEDEKARAAVEKGSGGEEAPPSEVALSHALPRPHTPARLTVGETWSVVLSASQHVGRPIFFAMAIILLAFLPVFVLSGQEGKLFHPLAWTKTFAVVGATILAVTLVPVMCALFIRGPFHSEDRNWVMRFLMWLYEPALDWALRWRKTVLLGAFAILVVSQVMAWGLPRGWQRHVEKHAPALAKLTQGFGREFMPTLNEGSLLFMPVLLPSTSLTEVKRIMAWQDTVISQLPEVASVGGKLGRAETATDPAPVEMIETTIMLKPEAQWRPGMTRQKLIAELTEKLSALPGYVPGFLQPIENRILMISTGIRAQVGVKILGDDLDVLQRVAFDVERVVQRVPGAVGVAPSRVQAKPYIEIEPDRVAIARYGLSVRDVMDVVETGIGGMNLTTTIEKRERYPIQVRLERHERDDLEQLGEILVPTATGAFIPLGQLATIRRVICPSELASENGRLRLFVQANVQDRDLGGFVEEIRERIRSDIEPELPPGVTIEYSGQYENQLHAEQTLRVIVPVVILVIFLLLYLVYHSVKEAAHVVLAIPFALSGGVFLQWWLGYNFSVAVWVGYIALFGIAIQTGVVMVVYLEEYLAKKQAERGDAFNRDDLIQAVKDGAKLRLRPKVMTVATTIASLLPIMWSTRPGAEVMQPLAAPVIGGTISSLVHILIVTPVIFAWLRERELRAAARSNNRPDRSVESGNTTQP
jgi:Cu(I)/Ag(I) efflux system membrane protein CusA/SilA